MASSMVSPPGLMHPRAGPSSSHRLSQTVSSVLSDFDSAYMPDLMSRSGLGGSYFSGDVPSLSQSVSDTTLVPGLVPPSGHATSSGRRARTITSVPLVANTASLPGLMPRSARPSSLDSRSGTLLSAQSVSDSATPRGLMPHSARLGSPDRRSSTLSSTQSVSDTASLPSLMPGSTRPGSSDC
ncbi:hypothetical protein RSOL_472450 [Rhizoctonia solani AG-3 Rhs1AP]|uniref:Uncharacterized protein n=2 Tax=Rhizoctonia solani AG-3 TaxID=1086053 RepID=A0A074RRQ3_9AGAM|nr:hypothetical protein RSOL_472450 [Rhizoctonia solani AG-3 Rhs1AP]KEP47348.1 hypothetical protein V565_159010 [Rhizoctonia solani 123E]